MKGHERSAPNGMTGAMWRRVELPSLPKHWHEPSSSLHTGSSTQMYRKETRNLCCLVSQHQGASVPREITAEIKKVSSLCNLLN